MVLETPALTRADPHCGLHADSRCRSIKQTPRLAWLAALRGGWRAVLDPENARTPEFLAEEARLLSDGEPVLDASAGTRPYAAIFVRQQYESCDVPHGFYRCRHDFERQLDAVPRPDAFYGAIIPTQVLEHVPEPEVALRELHRVLKPGGKLLLTVPLTAPLHGEPWNLFQFTQYGIAELARRTGFSVARCEKIGGAFWALGKRLPDAFRKLLKQYDPTRARKRGQSLSRAWAMTLGLLPLWLCAYPVAAYGFRPLCYWLDHLDIEKSFTLGFTAVLVKPA